MDKNWIKGMLIVTGLCVMTGCTKKDGEKKAEQPVIDESGYAAGESKGMAYPFAQSFSGGDGSESSPYEISTAEELALLSKYVNSSDREERKEYSGLHYILTADIVLNDTENFENWGQESPKYYWNPIGNGDSYASFEGDFDGAGHKISGLYIDIPSGAQIDSKQANYYVGLFGKTKEAEIKNLALEKSFIRVEGKNAGVAGIVAYGYGTQIRACINQTEIKVASAECGGIVGCLYGESNVVENCVENCINEGKITDSEYGGCGGIGGRVAGIIKNCRNIGDISGSGMANVGGICGIGAEEISGCINEGAITYTEGKYDGCGEILGSGGGKIWDCKNVGKVMGSGYIGGIMGSGGGMILDDCVNEGAVVGEADTQRMGGIIGELRSSKKSTVTIRRCCNQGEISESKESENGTSGGLFGGIMIDYQGKIDISNCVNEGSVKAEGMAGGLTGFFMVTNDKKGVREFRVTSCKNTGEINGAGWGIGGLIGTTTLLTLEKDVFLIEGCENTGDVVSNSDGAQTLTGGIAGHILMGKGSVEIRDCKNSGTLDVIIGDLSNEYVKNAAKEGLGSAVGGIVGSVSDRATVIGCVNTGKFLVNGKEERERLVRANEMVGLYTHMERE